MAVLGARSEALAGALIAAAAEPLRQAAEAAEAAEAAAATAAAAAAAAGDGADLPAADIAGWRPADVSSLLWGLGTLSGSAAAAADAAAPRPPAGWLADMTTLSRQLLPRCVRVWGRSLVGVHVWWCGACMCGGVNACSCSQSGVVVNTCM
jgi:hypothetical protein